MCQMRHTLFEQASPACSPIALVVARPGSISSGQVALPANLIGLPVRANSGIVVWRYISERKQAEKLGALGRMVSSVAHELNSFVSRSIGAILA